MEHPHLEPKPKRVPTPAESETLYHKPGPQASLPCGRGRVGHGRAEQARAIGLRARCFWRLQEFWLGSWIWIWRRLALQESEVGFKGLAVTIPSLFFCKNGLRSLCPHHPPARAAQRKPTAACAGMKACAPFVFVGFGASAVAFQAMSREDVPLYSGIPW